MLKRYKNELLAVIQRGGFNPTDFEPIETEADGCPAFILRYNRCDLRFVIRNSVQDPHVFDYAYTPFFPGKTTNFTEYKPDDDFTARFEIIVGALERWLKKHVQECIDEESVPDLWEAVKAGAFLSEKAESDKQPEEFSEAEKVQIKIALVSFERALVDEFKPSAEQLEGIRTQIKYLSEAVNRLNRFDWKGVALSTLIGIATSLTLDTEKGRQLYGLFQQAMTAVLHLLK